jgi:hypothetical protein
MLGRGPQERQYRIPSVPNTIPTAAPAFMWLLCWTGACPSVSLSLISEGSAIVDPDVAPPTGGAVGEALALGAASAGIETVGRDVGDLVRMLVETSLLPES